MTDFNEHPTKAPLREWAVNITVTGRDEYDSARLAVLATEAGFGSDVEGNDVKLPTQVLKAVDAGAAERAVTGGPLSLVVRAGEPSVVVTEVGAPTDEEPFDADTAEVVDRIYEAAGVTPDEEPVTDEDIATVIKHMHDAVTTEDETTPEHHGLPSTPVEDADTEGSTPAEEDREQTDEEAAALLDEATSTPQGEAEVASTTEGETAPEETATEPEAPAEEPKVEDKPKDKPKVEDKPKDKPKRGRGGRAKK